jgi:hypothetical protein
VAIDTLGLGEDCVVGGEEEIEEKLEQTGILVLESGKYEDILNGNGKQTNLLELRVVTGESITKHAKIRSSSLTVGQGQRVSPLAEDGTLEKLKLLAQRLPLWGMEFFGRHLDGRERLG